MEKTCIEYTGGSNNLKKIRALANSNRIYKHKGLLKIFQESYIFTFEKGDILVIWENGKVTKKGPEKLENSGIPLF